MTRGSSCSSRGPSWLGIVAGLLAAAVLVAGCGKKAAPGTMAPADMADAGGAEAEGAAAEPGWVDDVAGDPLADAEAELIAYEDAMLEAGFDLPAPVQASRTDTGKTSTKAADTGDPAARCQRICDLASSVCTLRDRICGLADEHEGQERYANVCERANLDCERATEACEGCNA